MSELLETLSENSDPFDRNWYKQNIFMKIFKAFSSFQGFVFLLFLCSFADYYFNAFYFRLGVIVLGDIFIVIKNTQREKNFLAALRNKNL